MSVAIRLKRGGRAHAPYYRIVVTDSRNRATGRVIEEIGLYHPVARPEPRTEVDKRKALEWLYKGAKPSDTARDVLSKHGVMEAFHKKVKPEDIPVEAPVDQEPGSQEPGSQQPASEKPAGETAETPAAEAATAAAPAAEADESGEKKEAPAAEGAES